MNNHAKLMLKEGRDKDYLVSIMFSNYDVNSNGNLEPIELQNVSILLIVIKIRNKSFGSRIRLISIDLKIIVITVQFRLMVLIRRNYSDSHFN